jgi:hypothetical protein
MRDPMRDHATDRRTFMTGAAVAALAAAGALNVAADCAEFHRH